MANISDVRRNEPMLRGRFSKCGYDWWWHSFTGYHEKTGEPRPFFIEFFTCNPALGGKEPLFGQVSEEARPSYMMVKCGSWGKDARQLHRYFAWDDVKLDIKQVPFQIEAGDCYCDEKHTKGNVIIDGSDAHPEWMCSDGTMSWDLEIDKKVAFNVGYGASTFFRRLAAFEMFWHAEGMKTAFKGYVDWNGERYLVRPEDCYGYSDKNWGGDFTSPWVWLSSNNLTSLKTGKKLEDSVFDIGGGRPVVFKIALNRQLLSDFWYEGTSYEFNFSKFWTGCKTEFSSTETDTQVIWHVEQRTRKAKMVTDVTCEKEDMMLFNYESPNGKKLHNRLWNGGNGVGTVKLYVKKGKEYELLDEVRAENIGCEYGEYDRN